MKQVLALIVLAIISATASAEDVAVPFSCKDISTGDRTIVRLSGTEQHMTSVTVGRMFFPNMIGARKLSENASELYLNDTDHKYEAGVIFGTDSTKISVIITGAKDSEAINVFDCSLAG